MCATLSVSLNLISLLSPIAEKKERTGEDWEDRRRDSCLDERNSWCGVLGIFCPSCGGSQCLSNPKPALSLQHTAAAASLLTLSFLLYSPVHAASFLCDIGLVPSCLLAGGVLAGGSLLCRQAGGMPDIAVF